MGSTIIIAVLAFLSTFAYATDIETTQPFVGQLYVPNIGEPRGLLLDSFGDIPVVGRVESKIIAIRETDHGNGSSTVRTTTIVNGNQLELNHGIAFNNGYLYASSDSTVYRWPYVPGQFSLIDENTVENVITNIEVNGHITRTLVFDDAGPLYVSIGIGSNQNIDQDSSRARIRRFNLQSLPITFASGELFADGVRNTVGLAFNSNGLLFGVDNGPDLLNRPDHGGNIWPENPGEEMNKFTYPPGTHYGQQFCEYRGTLTLNLILFTFTGVFWPYVASMIWSVELFQRNTPSAGVRISYPVMNLGRNSHGHRLWKMVFTQMSGAKIQVTPAHSAPLSIEFYNGKNCGVNGGFPCDSAGDAFIAFRGAWHQGVTYGYKVSWYKFNQNAELPTGEIFAPNATNSCNTCIRPVNAVFNKAGHLIVTADATNEIFRVAYNTQLPVITNVEGIEEEVTVPIPEHSNPEPSSPEPSSPEPNSGIKPFLTYLSIVIVAVSVLMNI